MGTCVSCALTNPSAKHSAWHCTQAVLLEYSLWRREPVRSVQVFWVTARWGFEGKPLATGKQTPGMVILQGA